MSATCDSCGAADAIVVSVPCTRKTVSESYVNGDILVRVCEACHTKDGISRAIVNSVSPDYLASIETYMNPTNAWDGETGTH